ncbi:MAG: ZIP family metal transporter [Nanoarchaeota archaeon]|nr:ZIP family metal transporter [Nanoarchaeota archaeon]
MDFSSWHPVWQALAAGGFTWLMTALGAACVFFLRKQNKKFLDSMLGFAAGVMIAASFWSLLAPAIDLSVELGGLPWVAPAIGFALGAIVMRLVDKFLPHLHIGEPISKAEGPKTSWRRTTLLITAITMHNVPEGLAVGVAFGAIAAGIPSASLPLAIALAVGIGIQNFPEGMAVSMPLRREGFSRWKSFTFGQLSGIVEPVAAVLGAVLVFVFRPLLPYALAFAAGAMIFVVVEELIPESQNSGNADLATMSVIAGFLVMMVLDVALG